MIVTNKDIDKDIAENLMIRHDVIKSDVARDMMLYMRDIYERKIETLSKDNAIMESALNAIGTVKNDRCEESECAGKECSSDKNAEEDATTGKENFEDMIQELMNSVLETLGQVETTEPETDEYAVCAGITCEGKESCSNYVENMDGTLEDIINNASEDIDFIKCIASGHLYFNAK